MRKIQDTLTWVSCFLAYAAIYAEQPGMREVLAYGKLVVLLE